jgi:hypothetical protein
MKPRNKRSSLMKTYSFKPWSIFWLMTAQLVVKVDQFPANRLNCWALSGEPTTKQTDSPGEFDRNEFSGSRTNPRQLH